MTFHAQVRVPGRDGDSRHVAERDGPVRRWYPAERDAPGAMIESPEGLGRHPEVLIERQRDFFRDRGQSVEWKTYSYDEPADLGARLASAGFVAGESETLLLGESEVIAQQPVAPSQLIVRAVSDERDLDRIADLHDLIWPGTRWVTAYFGQTMRQRPDLVRGCLVEERSAGPVLCAAWLQRVEGSNFAGLWGGATHPDWRRRGLYRATVAHRARAAAGSGARFLRVDASPASRPILELLGLHRVTTTTPYVLGRTPPERGSTPA